MSTLESSASRASASRSRELDRALCTFFVRDRCFGLDVALASEVIEVERVAAVPLAPPEVVGIFSLRGAPVPIVDLTSALGAGASRGTARIALVLRMDAMVVALAIDRMEGVLPTGRGTTTAANEDGESPLVAGFVEVPERAEVVTVISPPALLAHLDKLRFARAES